MAKQAATTLSKALEINQNLAIYGAFAEIGAGQEVARFFFQAGQASQTVAKTMSAYDMVYSDEIYGREESGRYVCESRLRKMLEKEFTLLHERLDATRGNKTTFFAFANTVATGGAKKKTCHGWMGIRFQKTPGGPFNDIVMHVRMLDRHRLQQQEMLGVLGVNLVWAAFNASTEQKKLIPALIENVKEGQVTIDLVRASGPDVAHLSNHLLNLELVNRGLADAILFAPDASIVSAADHLFQKPLLVERGTFRPITTTHLDLMEKGDAQFKTEFPSEKQKPWHLFELTMHNLQHGGEVDEKDFLERVRAIASTGHHVLVSNFFLFYRLKQFLREFTKAPIGMIVPANHLPKLFDPKHYEDLDGGILEGLGKLLDAQTKVFVYPHKTKDTCSTASAFHPSPELDPICRYFMIQKWIVDLSACDQTEEYIHSDMALEKIKQNEKGWEHWVPASVVALIQKEKLFGTK